MRTILLLQVFVFLVLLTTASGCRKPPAAAEVDAASTTLTTSAPLANTPPITAPTASSVAPASEEKPPTLAASANTPKPTAITKVEESKPITLEGIYGAPEELARKENDQSACTDPVKLDSPIHVVDSKGQTSRDGRGVGAHPVIGDTSRICVWHWLTKEKTDAPPMIPWGSHVVLRGTLSTPIVAHHPRALLLFDGAVVSATPPPTPAPPNALPEGDSVVFVKTVDVATRTLGLDLVYLYYGDAAHQMAIARADILIKPPPWFIVNDSPQLRSVTLESPSPTSASPQRLETVNGGGWVFVALDTLNKEPLKPYIVGISKGKVTKFQQITLPPP